MKFWKSYGYILLSYSISLGIGYMSFNFLKEEYSLLIATLLADIIVTVLIFMFSILLNNSSVYDPYWSLIPIFIVLLWIYQTEVKLNISTILILMSYLCWGLRLTVNWAINWKGFKHEDWRYMHFRNQFGRLYWVISLFGIHLFPTIMVFLGMIPTYYALFTLNQPNIFVLIIGFIITILAVILAFLADSQMKKHRASNHSSEAIRSGVWKYSRHPNYLGEISFWFGCFIMAISFGIDYVFTGIGFVFMVILFETYSIPAIEKKLLKSKNNYSEIIQTVPKLLPFFRHKS